MARKKDVFSNLSEEKKEKIKSFAEFVVSNPVILGEPILVNEKTGEIKERIDTDSITVLIECLNGYRQIAKTVDDEMKQSDKEMEKAKALDRAHSLRDSLEVGDKVIFSMGNVKLKRNYEREVVKITDKCFHVEFDEDYPCTITPDRPIGIRHIKFTALIDNLSKSENVGSSNNERTVA
jgi:hypothetical protein